MLIPILFLLLLLTGCGYALLRGGPSEIAAAVIILVGAVVTPLVQAAPTERWHHAEIGVMLVDTGMLLAFVGLLLRSKRFWPIWMCAFQLLSVAAHLGPIVRTRPIAIPFALEEQVWGWIILFQLIIVTRLACMRRKQMRDLH